MRRRIPYPLLAAGLLGMWLLLTQSFSLGQLLLAAAIALLATWAMTALRPEPPRLHTIAPIFRLAGIVMVDILRSNLAVARIILLPRQERVSRFVRVPLDLRNRYGLTLLALILTATPGTMWIQFDQGRGTLLVHVFDLVDEEAWIRLIKGRYEALLMEIFGP